MRAFLTVSWIEGKLFLRNFYSPFFSLVFPLMMLLLFGTIYGNAPDAFFGGHGAMDVSVPSYMGIALGVNGLMSLPLTLADYRQKKILKRFRATPANPSLLLLSQLFVSLLMTLIGVAAIILVGITVYGVHTPPTPWPFLAALALGIFAMFSVGLLVTSLAPSSRSAGVIASLLYFPMIFLSGATLPVELFPRSVRQVAQFLPLTHCVRLLRSGWVSGTLAGQWASLIVLGAVGVVFSTIAAFSFRWE
jgi:ABC-2 type transport system permease protein